MCQGYFFLTVSWSTFLSSRDDWWVIIPAYWLQSEHEIRCARDRKAVISSKAPKNWNTNSKEQIVSPFFQFLNEGNTAWHLFTTFVLRILHPYKVKCFKYFPVLDSNIETKLYGLRPIVYKNPKSELWCTPPSPSLPKHYTMEEQMSKLHIFCFSPSNFIEKQKFYVKM